MKKIKLLLAGILLLSSLGAITPQELKTRMDKAYAGIKTMQSDIEQTNYFSQIKHKTTYSGKLYYEPQRLLISFDKPTIQRLQIDAGRVSIYDAASKTLIRTELLPEFQKLNPLELLQHYWGKSTLSITKEEKNLVHIKLITQKDSFIRELTGSIDKVSGLVQSLSYADFNDNTVSYTFKNIKLNSSIPAAIWSFKPPKDTQEILQ
ncbi:MAG: outer membrane lipoprotein carrier protein LolA [Candidatus Cloacimonadaceae bacterium]|nr:outer membrane lipoprotein carrier protein LolA [Candidatus Cloacimonadaceae bacterium]